MDRTRHLRWILAVALLALPRLAFAACNITLALDSASGAPGSVVPIGETMGGATVNCVSTLTVGYYFDENQFDITPNTDCTANQGTIFFSKQRVCALHVATACTTDGDCPALSLCKEVLVGMLSSSHFTNGLLFTCNFHVKVGATPGIYSLIHDVANITADNGGTIGTSSGSINVVALTATPTLTPTIALAPSPTRTRTPLPVVGLVQIEDPVDLPPTFTPPAGTPTDTPTETPSRTETPSLTPTIVGGFTPTPSETATHVAGTDTPTETPTETPISVPASPAAGFVQIDEATTPGIPGPSDTPGGATRTPTPTPTRTRTITPGGPTLTPSHGPTVTPIAPGSCCQCTSPNRCFFPVPGVNCGDCLAIPNSTCLGIGPGICAPVTPATATPTPPTCYECPGADCQITPGPGCTPIVGAVCQ